MMSQSQTYTKGEAPATQKTNSNKGSRVTSERVALLVLGALLAAAVIVIYRFSFEHFQNNKTLQILKDRIEGLKKNITAIQGAKCKRGWEQHKGKCYYFSTTGQTWDESRRYCQRQGGDLVKIDSREKQQFLEFRLRDKMNFDEDNFWIGLTDSEKEGKWLWVDGSPLNPSLTFWSGTEPDNWRGKNSNGEDCVSMGEKEGAIDLKCWFDRHCDMDQSIICEKPAET